MSKQQFNLFPWQQVGVEWAFNIEQNTETKNGMICDEMGLGKTITATGLIQRNRLSRTLIVVPKCVMQQWKHVLQSMLTEDGFLILEFPIKTSPFLTELNMIRKPVVMLTTYGYATSLPSPSRRCHLNEFGWNRIIIDEFHMLGNGSKTQRHQMLSTYEASHMWGLTGTPIQNVTKELHVLFAFIKSCSILRRTIQTTIELAPKMPKLYIKLNKLPFYTSKERGLYSKAYDDYRFNRCYLFCALMNLKKISCHPMIYLMPNNGSTSKNRKRKFEQVEELEAEEEEQEPIQSQSQLSIPNAKRLHLIPSSSSISQTWSPIPIVRLWMQNHHSLQSQNQEQPQPPVLEFKWEEGTKFHHLIHTILIKQQPCVIFGTFVIELETLASIFQQYGKQVKILYGKLNGKERQTLLETIDKSNPMDMPDIFLVQIRSGGVGLNLQYYSQIYITIPDWNPAVMLQAIARCFRYGQQQDVEIHLLCLYDQLQQMSTIDEQIYKKINYKMLVIYLKCEIHFEETYPQQLLHDQLETSFPPTPTPFCL